MLGTTLSVVLLKSALGTPAYDSLRAVGISAQIWGALEALRRHLVPPWHACCEDETDLDA